MSMPSVSPSARHSSSSPSPTPSLHVLSSSPLSNCIPGMSTATPSKNATAVAEQSSSNEQDLSFQESEHQNSTSVNKELQRKALHRAKKYLKKLDATVLKKLLKSVTTPSKSPPKIRKPSAISPSPKSVQSALYQKINELQNKRSKKCLFVRKMFLDVLTPVKGSDLQVKETSSKYKRKEMKPATKAAVEFLDDIAVDMPGKRSVSRKTLQQKKILPKKMKRLHRDFRQKHPQHKISLRTFYRHLPHHILSSNKLAYRQCLCETCTTIDLKLDAINTIIEVPVDGRDVASESTLCPTPTLACIERECDLCGIAMFSKWLQEKLKVPLSEPVSWKSWEMVSDGKTKRRDLVEKKGTAEELLQELLKDLQMFSKHLFVFRWQFMQFRALKTNIPSQCAVAICDFAENFLCKKQDEVQSAYYHYKQVTVHPTVLHYQCPTCPEMVTDYLVYLSDDLNHDANMVKTMLDDTNKYLEAMDRNFQKLFVFSDGCAAQYKSKLPFYHLANSMNPIKMERFYFGSRHGKSACDACGGVIKNAVDGDIRTRECIIQNASTMYSHCQAHYTLAPPSNEPNSCCHTRRSFRLVETKDIDRTISSSSLTTLVGTRQLHAVRKVDCNVLEVRKLACFCSPCLQDDQDNCFNKSFVQPWQTVHLKPPVVSDTSVAEDISGDITPPVMEPVARKIFFDHLQEAFEHCNSYDQLEALVATTNLEPYDLPTEFPQTVVDVTGTVDKTALEHKPPALASLYPLVTTADGNCLPRALSLLAFGHEECHTELRCRIVVEMVNNFYSYMHGHTMGDSEDEGQKVAAFAAVVAEGSGLSADSVSLHQIEEILRAEILQIGKKNIFMGIWQLAAASNVLQCPVSSVYPQMGWEIIQQMNNRTFKPDQPKSRIPVYILWTSNRTDMSFSHWTSNHFVPMLPITDPNTEVSVSEQGDYASTSECHPFEYSTLIDSVTSLDEKDIEPGEFYVVEWCDKEYVAKVDNIWLDPATHTNMASLNFMVEVHENSGRFFWPLIEDTSCEPLTTIKRKVVLELDLNNSTQRRQMYNIR